MQRQKSLQEAEAAAKAAIYPVEKEGWGSDIYDQELLALNGLLRDKIESQ